MRITIKQYDTTVSVETGNEDVDAKEMLNLYKGLLVAIGYSPSVMGNDNGTWEWKDYER